MQRTDDAGSTTAIAVVLAVALLMGGGLLAVALQDPQATPATKDGPTPSASGKDRPTPAASAGGASAEATTTSADPIAIDWEGRLATTACAPTGPHVCFGTRVGEDDAYQDTGVEGPMASAKLTLTWDATTPLMEELYLAIYSVRVECGGNCHYFDGGAWVQGTSPLELHATDLEPNEGENLWIVVGSRSETPSPLYSQVETDQPFHVTGTVLPADLQGDQEHA